MCWDLEASYGHAIEAYRLAPDDSRRENISRVEKIIAGGATLENLPESSSELSVKAAAHVVSVEVRHSVAAVDVIGSDRLDDGLLAAAG